MLNELQKIEFEATIQIIAAIVSNKGYIGEDAIETSYLVTQALGIVRQTMDLVVNTSEAS